MSTNGILDFQNTNKVIFRGTDSNVVVDTSNASIGIGIQGTEKPGSNLHVIGDASISSNLKLTTDTSITVNSNVVTDFNGPHARLPITQAIVEHPIMHIDQTAERPKLWTANDNSSNISVKAGYTVTASTVYNSGVSNFDVFRLYDGHPDGNAGTYYCSGGTLGNGTSYSSTSGLYRDTTTSGGYSGYGGTPITTTVSGVSKAGEWLGIETPHPIVLKYVTMTSESHETYAHASPHKGVFAGSHDGVTWESISTFDDFMAGTDGTTRGNGNGTTDINIGPHRLDVNSTTAYKYHRMIVEAIQTTYGGAGGGAYLILDEMRWYGCNDNPPAGDTSMDTTFTSIMNTPQTTGANVYVDAKLSSGFTNQVTGPTPVGTNATHDNTNKYWELTGELTSNITVEANTFLEGDQPHAVSVWFNSSNLEANVSNTCVFSISDQEKLDSVNLDLQSNTWHNLTHSYQGEGGSRVTYLDGRKVSEDQAENTFGDYPPFAMTGYSQGGYVVSASSENSSFPAHEAFKDFPQADTLRWQANRAYTSAGLPHTDSPTTLTYKGEWIQLEQPYKLKINYLKMQAHSQAQHQPENWVILGSNDGTIWEFIKERLDASSFTVDSNGYHVNTDVIDSQKFYKYHRIVITKSGATAGSEQPIIIGISLYGHRENDLVRLPDPTNVLKYPHIKMTGPAQRGYVATESSKVNNNIDYGAWGAFNGNVEQGTYEGWGSQFNAYDGGANPSPARTSGSTATQFNSRYGDYINIKLPHKILLSKIHTFPRAPSSTGVRDYEHPDAGYLYASNDGFSTFQEIYSFDGVTVSTTYGVPVIHTIPSSHLGVNLIAYDEYRFQVTRLKGQNSFAVISEMELYGTGVDSIPIQIGGGNIDKVANFRVYDKFIEEDQALEIWDAQKNEFGRVKSSTTLHKGRLGLGTEEPEGRLAVLDEPHNLEEFPPRALSAEKSYIEGHGEFCVSMSSEYDSNYTGYKAFNKISRGGAGDWWSQKGGSTVGYSTSTGEFAGSSDPIYSTNVEGAIKFGHWLQIEFPYKINYRYSDIQAPHHTGRHPHTGYILGSNDLTGVWTSLHNFTNVTRTHEYESVRYTPPTVSTQTFKYFRLVIEKLAGNAHAGIIRWDIFGTREQGQSVLHDGQLTLTKSLNVPRIGPPLDADDTPRRDRLVVEYNTSTNPTFEGLVRDTSGRGFDGMFVGTASYDIADKAFSFDGNSDYITVADTGASGNWAHSFSFWFKPTSDNLNGVNLYGLGDITGGGKASILYIYTGTNATGTNRTLRASLYGDGQDIRGDQLTILTNRWYHMTVTNAGGVPTSANCKMYVDGVQYATHNNDSGGNGFTDSLNLAGGTLDIGRQRNYDGGYFPGQISNFKLYDTVLTAQEVKTLYDMGRCDDSHHVVNFSKTRVGIGLGDGEAPRGALDVRGETPFIGPGLVIDQNQSGNWGSSGQKANMNGLLLTQLGESGLTGTNYWNMSIQADNIYTNLLFSQRGNNTAYISAGDDNNQLDFTGQHRTFIKDIPFSRAEELEGLIVSSDQNKYIKLSGGIEAGSNAITINESLPVVSLSNVVTDKKCFGIISASEDPENRSDAYGRFVTPFKKEKGDTRVYINSVGEGAIWVVNTNGSLESGDYITTSNVAGYGQKQDDDILHNYTVAKITMDCDFEPVTQPIQIIKKDEEGENVLDEHGQIQWEDHLTDTEKAYKIRYLDTSGVNTDEANAVHIAAFVGCTYHCG